MITLLINLQATNPMDSIMSFLPMILIFGVIYFFFIRPQAKKQKQQETFSTSLEKGLEVVTTSGIIGRINKIEDNVITLQVDQKTFIRILASSVSKEMTDALNKPEEKK